MLARLARNRVPQAPTDHVFSKATYLSDPDGIGIELTVETPERFAGFEIGPSTIVIRDSDGRLRGGTEPLDVAEALSHLATRPRPALPRRHERRPRAPARRRPRAGAALLPRRDRVRRSHVHAGNRHGRPERRRPLPAPAGAQHLERPGGPAAARRHRGPASLHAPRRRRAALAAIRARLDADGTAYAVDGGLLVTHDPAGNAVHLGSRDGWAR